MDEFSQSTKDGQLICILQEHAINMREKKNVIRSNKIECQDFVDDTLMECYLEIELQSIKHGDWVESGGYWC